MKEIEKAENILDNQLSKDEFGNIIWKKGDVINAMNLFIKDVRMQRNNYEKLYVSEKQKNSDLELKYRSLLSIVKNSNFLINEFLINEPRNNTRLQTK